MNSIKKHYFIPLIVILDVVL